MLAPTHFRGLLGATATTDATNSTTKACAALEALLRAAAAACASAYAALCGAVDRVTQLFKTPTASCTGRAAAPIPKPAAAEPATTATATATATTTIATTRMRTTTLAAASTRTITPAPTAAPTATATTTRARARAPTTSPSTTRTLTGRIRPRPTRDVRAPRFTQADRDRVAAAMAAERRRQYAADFAAAQAPQSIAEMMRSNARPPPPPVEQLEREALMFPASRPRHDYFEIVAAGAPQIPLTPPDDMLPVFDDLLLPTHLAALPPAQEQLLLREFTRMPSLQSSLAQKRINLAVVRARGSPPPTVDSSVQCGCGWCPDHTAAYPLCAAVTMRRTMRSFGTRATTSHAGDAARRQSATAHRRITAAAVMAGGRAHA